MRLRFTVGDCLVSIICRRRGCDSRMAFLPPAKSAFVFLFFLPFTYTLPNRPLLFRYVAGKMLATLRAGVLHLKDTKHDNRVCIPRSCPCSSSGVRTATPLLIGRIFRVARHSPLRSGIPEISHLNFALGFFAAEFFPAGNFDGYPSSAAAF